MEFLGEGDYSGGLQAGWDSGLCHGLVENPCKNSRELVYTIHCLLQLSTTFCFAFVL